MLKKTVFTLMLALAGSLTASAALITSTGTKPSVGNGNSGSPYEIRTAEELRWFVHYENTRHWYPNDYAKLMCDIDLSSICGPDKGSWIPLGASEEDGAQGYFYGDFNGNGNKITGMYVNGEDTKNCGANPGFFGLVGGAHIYDLTLEGDIVQIYDNDRCGGLIAEVKNLTSKNTKMVNCESRVHFYLNDILPDGAEEPEATKSYQYFGGLVGEWKESNSYSIENCVFSGAFHFTNNGKENYSAGLIGITVCGIRFDIVNCTSFTGKGLPLIGYLGDNSYSYLSTIRNCISDGRIVELMYKTQQGYLKFIDNFYAGDYLLINKVVRTGIGGWIVHLPHDYSEDGNLQITAEEVGNGASAYTMNERKGGRYFTQTLGTDAVPYPNSRHSIVYRVKKYTQCGTEDYEWTYSNTDEDDITHREHVFADAEPYCTGCHEAVNPDYHATYEDGYYLLSNVAEVKWFWNLVNVTGSKNAKMKLTADIDMEGETMEPLKKFYGTIDGQGHTLANIHITSSDYSCVGLVGNLYSGGCIKNLALTGLVEGSNISSMGAFAGNVSADATISNVRNDCTVKATGTFNGFCSMEIGGIAGFVNGYHCTVTNCINNGPVVDATICNNDFEVNIGGVIGLVYSGSVGTFSNLVNNGVVGSYNNTVNGSAVTHFTYAPDSEPSFYYVTGISNPGMKCFFSDDSSYGTAINSLEMGSGKLAWTLFGKDYSAEDGVTQFWGQTIGTDFVPYPFVDEAHKGVYNKKNYYTCSDYTEYTNSSEDGDSSEHSWNGQHYCSVCCTIDESVVPKNEYNIYQISTPEQYNTFVQAVNAAASAGKPTKYASASILNDLDFTSTAHVSLDCLYGYLHGNGHKITIGDVSGTYQIAGAVDADGRVEYLDIVLGSTPDGTRWACETNRGQIIGCNITNGVVAKESDGIVLNCTGEIRGDFTPTGRFSNYLVKYFNGGEADSYRLYNSLNNVVQYEEIPLEKGETGELAYTLSHSSESQDGLWGQKLGNDADPRIYYGQTPTSDTYITRLTSYSAEYPAGKVEYMNAGMGLEAAPGYYKVCEDTESWTTRPAYNFIVDNGDGTYSAELINIDPTAQHYLPIEVQAEKVTYKEINTEGELVGKSYNPGDIVSIVFPVDMPISNINGTVYLFDGYMGDLVFTSMLNIDRVPANTPMLVKANGGSILIEDLTDVIVEPMTAPGFEQQVETTHLASFKQESLPTTKTLEDMVYVVYYVLNASCDKATLVKTDGENTANQFQTYFRIPSGTETNPEEINVTLSNTRELKTSILMECNLFSLPYGIVDENGWERIAHLSDTNPAVIFGNDINYDFHVDLTAYELLSITGNPNQKYNFYFNGTEPIEVTLDEDGIGFVELSNLAGSTHCLRGIRMDEGDVRADNVTAKVYKFLIDNATSLSGYGTLPEEHKGYALYDATGVSGAITLPLTNPNALVIGGSNIKGVTNRIEQSGDVMEGFTAESLAITDGNDLCYDFSVNCPQVTFNRSGISNDDVYAIAILPFAVNAAAGVYKYVDCDGSSVYFNSTEGTIPAYTPLVVDVKELTELNVSGANLKALVPNGTFNLTDASESENNMKYGFVTKRQENVSVVDNDEVNDYNVYGYSTNSHRFVRETESFSINPFRAFFLLPKSAAKTGINDAPAYAPSALNIVIDGKDVSDVDGIDNVIVDTESGDGVTYNLLGFPVSPGYRGIAIRNGKKIIIK